ncbi:fasciclin domain-containing protein [Sphingobacterium sp. LRF_L2]|uniref:fasciclin domain-containing protein n=1 Tax=Sphingobacterium sp. LRF_L2 TaxID=3369421 RepID=UPI003F60591A
MNIFRLPLCCLLLLLSLGSCRKDAFDAYYGRPDWLASPIYQQLDSMGDFKNFLYCIELSGYKNTLGSAGFWTVFAPTDAAFATFMQEKGIGSINDINKTIAEKIVRMSMAYDAERLEKLNDYFSQQGWITGYAYRRRSVYYDFVEDETQANGKVRKIISTNRTADGPYIESDNNNKHLTYFFDTYMGVRGLGAEDYNTFYPQSTYTGLNIGEAEIDPDRSNILAENGYIHVVNRVLFPAESIDQYLRGKTEYSAFKDIVDLFATYTYNADVTHRYNVLTGNTDSVFVKGYTLLNLALNNENYMKEDINDAQTNSFSVTVPNNQAVQDFAKRVLLKYYPSGTTIKDVFYNNSAILTEFLNAHFYQTQLWPSRFESEQNSLAETTKISRGNILEAKLLSNGAFYGVDACQTANVFQSVYGNVLLDPKYNLMQTALERFGLNLTLKIPTLRYMLVMVSDLELSRIGFEYDTYNTSDPIRYNGAAGTPKMRELIQNQIIPLGSESIPDLSGTGLLESYSGEYIKYNNNRLSSSGTLAKTESSEQLVKIDSTNIGTSLSGPLNGIAVYSSRALQSSEVTVGNFLKALGAESTSSPYYKFFNYLVNTSLWSASDGVISGVEVGLNYTMLIPNNDAIDQAIANGDLPSVVNSTSTLDQDKVKRFIQYHIVRNTFAIDGRKTGTFQTLCRDVAGDLQSIVVTLNQTNALQVSDNVGQTVSADVPKSNQLGQRILIHSLNGYLQNGI